MSNHIVALIYIDTLSFANVNRLLRATRSRSHPDPVQSDQLKGNRVPIPLCVRVSCSLVLFALVPVGYGVHNDDISGNDFARIDDACVVLTQSVHSDRVVDILEWHGLRR